MESNIPFTYLQKTGLDTYQLSVIAKPSIGHAFQADASRLWDGHPDRILALKEEKAAGLPFQTRYALTRVTQPNCQAVVKVDFNETGIAAGPKTTTRITQLNFLDADDLVGFADNKAFQPHLYLTVEPGTHQYEVHVLICNAPGRTFKLESLNYGDAGAVILKLREMEGGTSEYFNQTFPFTGVADGSIAVHVCDLDGHLQAKGKVRHSVADTKPFY